MSADLTTADEAIADLLRAVASAMAEAPAPPAGLEGAAFERYLGDVVALTFNGDDAARVALLARLLAAARAWAAQREPERGLPPYAWVRRLERPLRRWERDRRLGTASPRPRPDEIDARLAMFAAAHGDDAVIGLDTVALAVAELVAVHVLAGATTVEDAVAARAALAPLRDDAAALVRLRTPDLGPGVFERPGATLAHVEQATWQIEQLLAHPPAAGELPLLRALWLEAAAALVYAPDVYEGREQDEDRWRRVLDLAAEKLTVGGLVADASGFDAAATLSLVRSVALALAALWLDEARDGGRDVPAVPLLEARLLAAAAQALIAAWAVERRG